MTEFPARDRVKIFALKFAPSFDRFDFGHSILFRISDFVLRVCSAENEKRKNFQ
jgi:hypothetical protein